MERLTDHGYIPERVVANMAVPQLSEIYKKLCEYEDTGMTPEQVQGLLDREMTVTPYHEYDDSCICPGCGKEIEDYDVTKIRFCPECGQKWKWD
jgi:rubredoxin